MQTELLSTLGLCKRAGMLAVGEEPVEAVARARDARVILLAADASENTVRRAAHFAEAGQCLWLRLPFSKAELGQAVGRTSCAVTAVTDIGFAAAMVRRLAQEDPDTYKDAAERLELKARRAAERKEELAVHEKNLRREKKCPLPPPSPEPKQAPRTGKPGAAPAPNGSDKRPFRAGKPGGASAPNGSDKRPFRAGKPGAAPASDGSSKRPFRGEKGRPAQGTDHTFRKKPNWAFSKEETPQGQKGPKRFSDKGPRPPYGKPAHSAAPHSRHSGGPPSGSGRSGGPRGSAKPASPYLHSRPVKRGKGSFRKKES